MRSVGIPLSSILAAAVWLSPAAGAAENAYDWLTKMNRANRVLSYDGTIVYQQGQQLEAMRIIHSAKNGSVKERLVSLNGKGSAREIIRDDKQVICYLPERQSVVVEHRLTRKKSFPAILPERLGQLEKYYEIRHSSTSARVAGRETQLVNIKPRDSYRYGYWLWADIETGLLLKAALVDHMGNTLEQFMFSQINIGVTIEPRELEPAVSTENMAWYWGKSIEPAAARPLPEWLARQVPNGFTLSSQIIRKNPTRDKPVKHLVYSDGLAAVSVFIEQVDEDSSAVMKGPSRMGAVHAYGDVIDGYQVTVVGEVPSATVELIARSVTSQR